jgi:hypothetical protein
MTYYYQGHFVSLDDMITLQAISATRDYEIMGEDVKLIMN